MGHRVERNGRATEFNLLQPNGLYPKNDFDAAQGFPICQLRKIHCVGLIQTREVIYSVCSPMLGHIAAKCAHGQVGHEPKKHELALVHNGTPRNCAKGHQFAARPLH